jgi:predicted  nucleic acid-binding Zn-ribbon protein
MTLNERAETRRETFYKLTNSADVPEVPVGSRNLIIRSQIQNGYIDNTGNLAILNDHFTTGFIDCQNAKQFTVTAPKFDGGLLEWYRLIKYDADKQFIDRELFIYDDNSDKTVKTITLADDVSYFKVSFDGVYDESFKIERGSVATDYSQAPEDLGWSGTPLVPTQQQRYLWKFEYVYYSDGSVEVAQPVNLSIAGADADTTGITDAINQTNQTVTSLQNSVSQAQSDLATVSSNLTQARQNLESSIASVNTKAQAVETSLAQVQSTTNANSQKTATLENDLNGLSARFSSLKIGGVNLIKQSTARIGLRLGTDAGMSADQMHALTDWIKVEPNTTYTLTTYEDVDEPNMYYSLAFYSSNDNDYSGWISRPTGAATAANLKGGKHYQTPANAKYAKVSYPINYPKVKLERGNIATDYSPNEADLELKVADYKQTADQNYASLQSTVQALDGTVTANKATADQTAAGFQTRIESLETYKDGESTRANQYFESAKTETARQLTAERTAIANDYVAKSTYTSDVTGIRNDLTATTTTANTTKNNLASYQASNDQAVASLQSSLQTTDGNVSSLQTQINAVPGQITSAVSAVEDKIPTSLGGRNLIIKSQIQNGYIDNTGNLASSNSQFTTGFIDGADNKQFTITAPKFSDGFACFRLIKYDADKQFIDREIFNYDDNSDKTIKVITLADDVSYFKVSFDGLYEEPFKIERGSLSTDWSPAPEDTINQISSLSSQIQQTANGMTLLATKTELNTAKSDLQTGITTATSKADNAQATADSNAQTISTHTTQISALNTGLQAKVSQSDFNSLSGRVTTAESNLTATANQLSSQISSVNERIPTQIGAVNLIKQSTARKGLRLGTDAGMFADQMHALTDWIEVEPNTTYTLTTYEDVDEANMYYSLAFYSNNADDYSGWISRPTGAATAANLKGGKQYASPANAAYAKVSYPINYPKVKLERGNIATDYSPNPEDYDAALTQAKTEIKQTTDAITASVSNVQTAASNAQSTANTAVSKADAAQAGVNTLDSTTVKSASLNLDNNGFVTKVGKTIDGNKFATMIAQNANNVKIIADEMQVTANMIVDGAVTAEKLDVNNLSAVNSDLGEIKGGSLLLQENKPAGSATDNWGTYDRPAYKQGLYMDNRAFASSGAIQRKNGSETTPTDMPLAVLQAGELRFLVVDYNDNLKNVVHYGLSDPDFGAIRFEIDSELKRRLTMTSSGYLNFQASNYTNWTSTGVSGCEYMIQGRLVLVNYDVTFNSAGTHTIGGIPQEFTKKSLMMTAKAWTITPRDKNIQLNSDGSLHILDAEANVNYRGTLVFSY